MVKYLILQHPGHNRAYDSEAAQLAVSELSIASKRLSVKCTAIETQEVAGVSYITLNCNDDLTTEDIDILSRLSFVFAIFHQFGIYAEDGLLPIPFTRHEYIDSKLCGLQKSTGKPNDLFTRMMVNVALLASDFSYQDDIHVLDPLSGRGTTLYEAAIYGFHASGIEISQKAVLENYTVFKKYLQDERYKYLSDRRMVYGKTKAEAIFIDEFQYANSKEAFKEEEQRKNLSIVNGLSQEADKYFKKNSINLIVGELPYVITPNQAGAGKSTTASRNPLEILRESLQPWKTVLKSGGTIVLAWNSLMLPKNRLSILFEEQGFEVQKQAAYNGFEHAVDKKTIWRDIIVAKKL